MAARNSVKNTPNQLTGVKLSKALLTKPVCSESIVAWMASGWDVAEALKVSITLAMLAIAT